MGLVGYIDEDTHERIVARAPFTPGELDVVLSIEGNSRTIRRYAAGGSSPERNYDYIGRLYPAGKLLLDRAGTIEKIAKISAEADKALSLKFRQESSYALTLGDQQRLIGEFLYVRNLLESMPQVRL